MGRNWADGAGNLFASTIVRLRPHDPPAQTLTLVAAVAMAEAIAAFAPGIATIKWPNDLMVGNAKLSGILLERSGNAVVIGFGVNLSSHPMLPDRSTTSLAAEGFSVGPDALLVKLCDRFAVWVARWRMGDLSIVRSTWEKMAHPVGTSLRVRLPDGREQSGRFAGLEVDGALRLIDQGGKPVIVHAGDVSA